MAQNKVPGRRKIIVAFVFDKETRDSDKSLESEIKRTEDLGKYEIHHFYGAEELVREIHPDNSKKIQIVVSQWGRGSVGKNIYNYLEGKDFNPKIAFIAVDVRAIPCVEEIVELTDKGAHCLQAPIYQGRLSKVLSDAKKTHKVRGAGEKYLTRSGADGLLYKT